MSLGLYILVDSAPAPESDTIKWARWFESADRGVARDELPSGTFVSTVFLAIDHSFNPHSRRPILYETMVFGGPLDGEQLRYRTRDEALAGHRVMLEAVQKAESESWPMDTL
jgi:hypothetical protein